MTTKSVADASAELYKLLEGFTSEERGRIVKGTLMLFGEVVPTAGMELRGGEDIDTPAAVGGAGFKDARAFFETKAPTSKIEELAVAARFREQKEGAERHTKKEFASVITNARRNFDAHNFKRDLDNARTAGFFNKGGSEKEGFILSYYGQNYVDALPDREKLKTLKRPKKAAGTKAKSKNKASQAEAS